MEVLKDLAVRGRTVPNIRDFRVRVMVVMYVMYATPRGLYPTLLLAN